MEENLCLELILRLHKFRHFGQNPVEPLKIGIYFGFCPKSCGISEKMSSS